MGTAHGGDLWWLLRPDRVALQGLWVWKAELDTNDRRQSHCIMNGGDRIGSGSDGGAAADPAASDDRARRQRRGKQQQEGMATFDNRSFACNEGWVVGGEVCF